MRGVSVGAAGPICSRPAHELGAVPHNEKESVLCGLQRSPMEKTSKENLESGQIQMQREC